MSIIRLLNTLFLSLLLITNSWPVMAAVDASVAPEKGAQHSHLVENLGPIMDNLEKLQRLLDRSQFDMEELLLALDYDHDQVIAYVKEKVGLDLYRGTLRGAQGTLMSQAGNPLDQSILLAKLLKDAGLDARIARGKLTTDEAQLVVKEMSKTRPARPPAIAEADQQSAIEILRNLDKLDLGFGIEDSASLFESPEVSTFANYDVVQQTAKDLGQKLQSSQINLVASDDHELIEETTDYFWVQYRLGPGEWSNAHPAFAGESPIDPEFTTVLVDEVPAELHHKFAMQVFVETTSGKKLETKPVSAKWERPIANLIGVPLAFANMPNTLLNSTAMVPNLRKAVEDASWFAPIFDGGLTMATNYFDKNGNIIDPMAAGSAAAGIFQQVNSLFGKASGDLGGGGRPTLTGQWLEFTFTEPGGKTRTHQRVILDRTGPAAREAGELPEPSEPITTSELATLLQRHTFMITAGETPKAMAMDTAIQGLLDSRPAVEQLVDTGISDESKGADWTRALKRAPQYWTGHLSLFTLLDLGNDLSEGHLVYRSGPSLVIHTEGFSGADSYIRSIDIVQSPRRAIDLRSELPSLDPRALITTGVWETVHEGLLLGSKGKPLNTMIVFKRVQETGAGTVAFPPEAGSVDITLNDRSKFAILSDLKNGFAVIAPDADQPDGYGWWRINPSTGETLGQIADGRGGAVEYLEGLALGISISLLAVGIIGCTKAYDPPTLADVDEARGNLACCFLANAILFAVGFVQVLRAGMLWDAYWSQQPTLCSG